MNTSKDFWSWHRLWRTLFANLELVIALVAASASILLHDLEQRQQQLNILTLLVALLVVSKLREEFNKPADPKEIIHQVEEQLTQIEDSLNAMRPNISGIKCANTKDYIALFSGFTGHYFAYNPSFRLEEEHPEIDRTAIQNAVFTNRYKNSAFEKACYLFLTKDDAGKHDLNVFREMMVDVAKVCPEIKSKIEVRELNNENAESDGEFYTGTKNNVLVSILEPRLRALSKSRGRPYYYLMICDDDINKTRIKEYFNDRWMLAEKVTIF